MRTSPQFALILSAIAAVKAAKGSKCRHRRHGNSNIVPVVLTEYIATSEAASHVINSVATPSVEPVESSQKQDVTEIILTAPTKAAQIPESGKDAEEVKIQETVTSSRKAALSSIRQTRENTKSTAAGVSLKDSIKRFSGRPNQSEVLFETPWIVFSMNYNYQYIKGSSCVGYYNYTGSGDEQTIHWSVLWDINPMVGINLVNGYNFIGLTQGLETRLSDIKNIPPKYEWNTNKTTEYQDNVGYDFMTRDLKGDSTSCRAQELMLWLNWEGGQILSAGGVNADTGITVTSLLRPEDSQFGDETGGSFEGDIKDWLVALSTNGIFKADTYVDVGNVGMEPYYGVVDFDNHLSLRINV
ncbi:hypothetical protein FOVSG1_006625 [Fusarium oxysporum f. sp. vasinfectum]